MYVQIKQHGLTGQPDLNPLRQEFSRNHALRLPRLLHSDLMQMVLAHIEFASWTTYDHGRIGRELLLGSAGTLAALRFVMNTPDFLRTIERVTQWGPISVFDGRIYRMVPGTDHHDSWHDDVSRNRLIGMSLNLGSRPYCGGVFQLRNKRDGKVLCELPNVIRGDAILFRISPDLEHQITPTEGTEPRLLSLVGSDPKHQIGFLRSSGLGATL